MADHPLGSIVRILIDPPTDQDGGVVVPDSITVSVRRPDAATDGPFTLVYDSVLNSYAYAYVPPISGEYTWRAVATGAGAGADEGSFYIFPAYAAPADAWKPALTDVAALVPTRTIDSSGSEQGTFTTGTTPTATQVGAYIAQIVGEIVGTVGEVPSEAFAQAKGVASLGVAWLVERSYPPTADVQNVANDFVADYRASLRLLEQSVRNVSRSGSRAVSVSLGSFTWPEV